MQCQGTGQQGPLRACTGKGHEQQQLRLLQGAEREVGTALRVGGAAPSLAYF